jgi:hypothetical protein
MGGQRLIHREQHHRPADVLLQAQALDLFTQARDCVVISATAYQDVCQALVHLRDLPMACQPLRTLALEPGVERLDL